MADVQQTLVARLQSDWCSVLEDEASSDAELVVGVERIAVHRLVLRARCETLWAQLRAQERDGDGRPALRFPYLSPAAVRTVVRYLYTAKVPRTLTYPNLTLSYFHIFV